MPLLVCATPIGNLQDVTLRVLDALQEADLVVCEDTRRTRALLERHGIKARVRSLDRHAEARRIPQLLPLLETGETLVLVSDAGLPGVNDPGARLIDAAIAAGVPVSVLPGPTAAAAALVVSGLAGERFLVVGFVPRTEQGRRGLWDELRGLAWPVVAFESARRLPATLASLAATEPDRPVAVCRELTKLHEEVVRGRAAEVADTFAEPPRGEVTIVIGAAPAGAEADAIEPAVLSALAALVELGVPRRRAADLIGGLVDQPANRLYRASL